jgi:dihydrofolate reductase
LLDELRLTTCPIVVGGGLRLFDRVTDRLYFRVRESTTLGNGVMVTTYRPTGD